MQAQHVQQNPPQMQLVGASQQDISPQVSQQVIPFTTEDSQKNVCAAEETVTWVFVSSNFFMSKLLS